jgi:CRISPR-associated protein Csb2
MKRCPVQPVPEWVSGHRPEGPPSEADHLAFLALADVGREHANGAILGLALAVPTNVPAEDQARCLDNLLVDEAALPRTLRLTLGRLGVLELELDDRKVRQVALRSETWTAAGSAKPSRRWATVTPISFDRHPKGKDRWRQAEESVLRACVRIGLPAPSEIALSPDPFFAGSPHVRHLPRLERPNGGGSIQHLHAALTFREPVSGPVLLGAGRYRGYGLCRPADSERSDDPQHP